MFLFSNYATDVGFALMALLFPFCSVLASDSPTTFSNLREASSGGVRRRLFCVTGGHLEPSRQSVNICEINGQVDGEMVGEMNNSSI